MGSSDAGRQGLVLLVGIIRDLPLYPGESSHTCHNPKSIRLVLPASAPSLEQFRQARPVWDRAAEMILLAARTGRKADIAEATRSILVALEKENWLKGRR
jgi:hypothetical protein